MNSDSKDNRRAGHPVIEFAQNMKNLKRKQNGKKRTATRNGANTTGVSMDRARLIAIEFCLFHYPTLYTAGVPEPSMLRDTKVWSVPVVLEDPDAGISREVGRVLIHKQTAKVMDHTPVRRVVAQGEKLYQGPKDAGASAALSSTKK